MVKLLQGNLALDLNPRNDTLLGGGAKKKGGFSKGEASQKKNSLNFLHRGERLPASFLAPSSLLKNIFTTVEEGEIILQELVSPKVKTVQIRKGKEISVSSPSSHRSFENAWISMDSSGYNDGPRRTTLVIDYRTMVWRTTLVWLKIGNTVANIYSELLEEARDHACNSWLSGWNKTSSNHNALAPLVQSPHVLRNQSNIVIDSSTVHGLGLVHLEKAFNFYNELHAYRASCGVDGAKGNVQNIAILLPGLASILQPSVYDIMKVVVTGNDLGISSHEKHMFTSMNSSHGSTFQEYSLPEPNFSEFRGALSSFGPSTSNGSLVETLSGP
ncbi:hypothetical protein VNO77_15834 [Canavalia gladiata]|uniref:Uncharacterized protein n=1 Tax=Canavalia gladiata TaxID=3824 RepID=A0AAN9LZD5_CANGL